MGGYTVNPNIGNSDFALACYTADGTLDASFGDHGILTGYFPTSKTYFTSTAIQGNKIIVAGSSNEHLALARYTAEGTLDTSFGENGKVISDFFSSEETATSIALQGDKIIVGGSVFIRYTADGILDSSFGGNGKVTTGFDASSIAMQGDKILVAGYIRNVEDGTSDFILARYTVDGMSDSAFGVDGKVVTDFDYAYGSIDRANSIALQGDKILVAGYTTRDIFWDDYNPEFALVRYTAEGDLDSSFGGNGKVITGFGTNRDRASSIAIQGSKIVLAGYTTNLDNGNTDFALARYTPNGILDTSFGEHGKVTTDFNNSDDYATSMALQGDKIIVAGTNLVRYMANGTLDSSFGVNGIAGTYFFIQEIALHENRLYAVGSTSQKDGNTYGVLAAYQLEAPEPAISIADVTVPESKRFAVVTARLSTLVAQRVRVQYTTRNKTASYPQDYLPVKGTLLFIPGVNTTARIYIPVIDDNECEATEQFEIFLTNAHNATIKDSVAAVTILDNDDVLITKQSTSLHIHASPNPSAGAFTVQLRGSYHKQPVSVRVYNVSGMLLEERKNISIGQSLCLGDQYKAGTYFIEVRQGSQSVQTTVIKTGK